MIVLEKMQRRFRRQAIGVLIGLAAWHLAAGGPIVAAAELAKRATSPNIIVLMADDMGYGDVGLHGGAARTPNLDHLAQTGLELERFYVYPVCSPTRAASLTGTIPHRFGIAGPVTPRDPGLPSNVGTLPRTLKAAGYQTYLVGKWHVGNRTSAKQLGFDHFYGFLGAQVDYEKHTGLGGNLDWQRNGTPVEEKGYSTFLLADEAIRLILQRDPQRPFYLQLAFNAPHFPFQAPDDFLADYRHLSGNAGIYAAMIAAMDSAVGRVLETLDKQGLSNDTLVVFFSDNGAPQRVGSNGKLRGGKDGLYEGGIRTPCFLRWPGNLKEGTKYAEPVAVYDLLPTLLAAVGLSMKESPKLDGQNLWSAFCDGTTVVRPPILIATSDWAWIDGNLKLIQTIDGKRELFDLKADPAETNDLAARRSDDVERMATQLAALVRQLPKIESRPRPNRGIPPGPFRPGAKPGATSPSS